MCVGGGGGAGVQNRRGPGEVLPLQKGRAGGGGAQKVLRYF